MQLFSATLFLTFFLSTGVNDSLCLLLVMRGIKGIEYDTVDAVSVCLSYNMDVYLFPY